MEPLLAQQYVLQQLGPEAPQRIQQALQWTQIFFQRYVGYMTSQPDLGHQILEACIGSITPVVPIPEVLVGGALTDLLKITAQEDKQKKETFLQAYRRIQTSQDLLPQEKQRQLNAARQLYIEESYETPFFNKLFHVLTILILLMMIFVILYNLVTWTEAKAEEFKTQCLRPDLNEPPEAILARDLLGIDPEYFRVSQKDVDTAQEQYDRMYKLWDTASNAVDNLVVKWNTEQEPILRTAGATEEGITLAKAEFIRVATLARENAFVAKQAAEITVNQFKKILGLRLCGLTEKVINVAGKLQTAAQYTGTFALGRISTSKAFAGATSLQDITSLLQTSISEDSLFKSIGSLIDPSYWYAQIGAGGITSMGIYYFVHSFVKARFLQTSTYWPMIQNRFYQGYDFADLPEALQVYRATEPGLLYAPWIFPKAVGAPPVEPAAPVAAIFDAEEIEQKIKDYEIAKALWCSDDPKDHEYAKKLAQEGGFTLPDRSSCSGGSTVRGRSKSVTKSARGRSQSTARRR